MLTVARRFLHCDADSADAVQDTLLAALQAIDSFAGHAKLWTWLYRILVNTCLMRLRSQARSRSVSLDDVLPALEEAGRPSCALTQAARAEIRAHVRACIDRLPAAYRTVVLLRDIEELDTDQTAERLHTSPGAVKTRLHRARQALRILLEPLYLAERGRPGNLAPSALG
jgi:RNA polymerase sigma-70 factor (ECF subfamily)